MVGLVWLVNPLACQAPPTGQAGVAQEQDAETAARTRIVLQQVDVLMRDSENGRAHRLLSQAIESGLNDADIYQRRAELLVLLQCYELALEDLRRVANKGVKRADTALLLGHVHEMLGEYDKAQRQYLETRRIGVGLPELHNKIDALQRKIEDRRRTLKLGLRSLAEADTDQVWELLTLALSIGDEEAARTIVQQWEKVSQGGAFTDWGEARILEWADDWVGALRIYERTVGSSCDKERAIANALARMGQWDKSMVHCANALEQEPKDTVSLRLFCLGKLWRQDYVEYKRLLQRSLDAMNERK